MTDEKDTSGPAPDARDEDAPIAPEPSRSAGAPSDGADGDRDVVHAPTVVEVPVVDAPKVESHEQNQDEDRWGSVAREILGGTPMVSLLAVVVAFIVGGVLIAATDEQVQAASGYFFARPGDTFAAIGSAVGGAYWALFQGSILNFSRPEGGFLTVIRPLTETLHFAAPLIAAGLGVAVAFRVGMFNIGGRGQMLAAAAAAGWVGFSFPMPPVLHVIAALVAGMVAGALWAGIAGLLKARTGAHEVITTIMLNFVALWLLSYLIRTPDLLQAPGSNNPITPGTLESAQLPPLLGSQFNLTWGIVLSVAAVVAAWWLIERSSLGFRFRAVGLNPQAALNAGMNVKTVYVQAMLVAGAFMGLAGAQQVQATVTTGFTSGIDAGIGFDAITVALLGRSNPWGVLAAGLLFGAFKAGGFRMQAAEGVPIDIVLVVQSVIVLCIAAPPLVRTIFRLPKPTGGNR